MVAPEAAPKQYRQSADISVFMLPYNGQKFIAETKCGTTVEVKHHRESIFV